MPLLVIVEKKIRTQLNVNNIKKLLCQDNEQVWNFGGTGKNYIIWEHD